MNRLALRCWTMVVLLVLSSAWPNVLLGACECCHGPDQVVTASPEQAPIARSCCSTKQTEGVSNPAQPASQCHQDERPDSDEPCAPGSCHCPRPCCASLPVAIDLASDASHPELAVLPDMSHAHVPDLISVDLSDEIPHPPKS